MAHFVIVVDFIKGYSFPLSLVWKFTLFGLIVKIILMRFRIVMIVGDRRWIGDSFFLHGSMLSHRRSVSDPSKKLR